MPPPPPSVPCWRPPEASPLDPRVHAFRPDLADATLRGRVDAARFARVTPMRCFGEFATLHFAADSDSEASSELLSGETFQVLDGGDAWAWGWCGHDAYVGYVLADQLKSSDHALTQRVIARKAPMFAKSSIKARIDHRLPLGSLLVAQAENGDFVCDPARGYIHRRHVAPVGEHAADPVEVASRLIGEPYVWGGRGGQGVDCSGLIQVALGMCGIAAPRDGDQQMAALGRAVDAADARRGDLVFFPGHVGIMADAENLLHANAHWMTTLIEPLADVVARLAPAHPQPILAVKRID